MELGGPQILVGNEIISNAGRDQSRLAPLLANLIDLRFQLGLGIVCVELKHFAVVVIEFTHQGPSLELKLGDRQHGVGMPGVFTVNIEFRAEQFVNEGVNANNR